MQTPKQGLTCRPEALIEMDQLPPLFHRERASNRSARPGRLSFNKSSIELFTLAVQSFGRLGTEGSEPID